jgi:hydroxymethylpyrimidine pyrophosphatase-like HAD family hydrolase
LNKILFVDLDDTLFQTLAKYSGDSTLEPVAYYKSGEPCSYSSQKQRSLFNFFDTNMTVIPTTARDLDAFRRVKLDFNSYAICNFGGTVILPSGEIDGAWAEHITTRLTPLVPSLHLLLADINNFCFASNFPGRAKIISDHGTDFYLVIKDPERQIQRLDIIEREIIFPWLAKQNNAFFVHKNANNLAVVPSIINKSHAVEYLITSLKKADKDVITFGMGDSKTDAKFMALCDYAITPKQSQLSSHMELA